MGKYNYLIIPNWKIRIATKFEEIDFDFVKKKYDKLLNFHQENDVSSLYEKDLTKLTLIDITMVLNAYNVISLFYEPYGYIELLIYYLHITNIEYKIISEYAVEELEKYKDCVTVDI